MSRTSPKRLGIYKKIPKLPGFAVSVIRNGKVVYKNGFGYADLKKKTPFTVDTSQPIGSISKTFIGLSIAKLVDEGKISLDTEINDVLPFKVVHPKFRDDPITVRHLVTHSSGIVDREDFYEGVYEKRSVPSKSLGVFLKSYFQKTGADYKDSNFSSNKPGTAYQYSNLGSALAAFVVEVVSKEKFAEYTYTNVFRPMRMFNTGWFWNDVKFHSQLYDKKYEPYPPYTLLSFPDGALRSNVRDLSKYATEMLKLDSGQSKIFRGSAYNSLFEGKFDPKSSPKNLDASKLNFGIFWTVRPSGTIGHDGSDPGLSTFLYFNRKTKSGRIFITNVDLEENEDDFKAFLKVWKILGNHSKSAAKS